MAFFLFCSDGASLIKGEDFASGNSIVNGEGFSSVMLGLILLESSNTAKPSSSAIFVGK